MTADFDRTIHCPFCGTQIELASCPIVATNSLMMDRLRRELRGASSVAPTPQPAPSDDGPLDLDAALDETPSAPAPSAPAPPPAAPSGRGRFSIGDDLVSSVDEVARVVLAGPPLRPPAPEKQSRWRSAPVHPLPSPTELSASQEGLRARAARACPNPACHHPLPAAVDDRDPFVVALVGNTAASKTSLLAALVDSAEKADGRDALGLAEFVLAEATTNRLRRIVKSYRRGDRTEATQAEALKGPLEFHITLDSHPDSPIVLIVNDIPGEAYMDLEQRAMYASHVQWADVILYVINPEETPVIDLVGSDTDQATVLNGVHADLAQTRDPSPHALADRFPPLIAVVAKADVLVEEGVLDINDLGAAALATALEKVDADDVLAAIERWPQVTLVAAAAMPEHGPVVGITQTFGAVFRSVSDLDR